MSITRDDVKHVAHLAKLELTESEIDEYTRQLGDILTYMEKLNQLDTTDVKPLSHVMEVTNAFREDEPQPSLDREDALSNAPESDDEFFLVPKVI